jgi:enoyl-CoA hydratase/carnithine racemase
MRDDLWELLGAVDDDPSMAAIVIRGEGEKSFCAGADLSEFGSAPSPSVARTVRWERDVFGRLRHLDAVTIAALHGHVIGSGLEIAMLCDLRIASDHAVFRMPETGLGLIPAATGTQTLPRFARQGRALDMLLTGRPVNALEARSKGLVQRVVPRQDLLAAAMDLAQQVASLPRNAALAVRQAVQTALDTTLERGLREEQRLAERVNAAQTLRG